MGSSRQRPIPNPTQAGVPIIPEDEGGKSSAGSSLSSFLRPQEDAEYEGDEGGREERRAPATVMGTKRMGLVILPELLTNAIQQEINGTYSFPPG